MMVLADTSVWVEFLRGRPPYREGLSRLLKEGKVLAVEPVFAELLQGARDDRERVLLLEYWDNLPKPDVPDLWIMAGETSGRHRWTSKGVGLVDAAILTAARRTSSSLWTLDVRLKSLLKRAETFEIDS